jgi:hypothetical protein
MSDWNLDDRKLLDTKRGVIEQKENRGVSKKQKRPFAIWMQPAEPSRWGGWFRTPCVARRCVSLEHAEQMLEKLRRADVKKRWTYWIVEKE